MNDYLLAAYGIMWLILFGYIFSIDQRHAKLQKELARLQEVLEKTGKQDRAPVVKPTQSPPLGGKGIGGVS